MKTRALIYCENEFGKVDGKVANGLVRHSEKYQIVGVIDSTKDGLDVGEYLDEIKNDVPIFASIADAIKVLNFIPEYYIWGIAPITSFLNKQEREIIINAMKMGMNIVNGLPEYLTDDKEFIQKAIDYNVHINDVRKPPKRECQHNFTGKINSVKTPIITVMGTDCAVGKRTTALCLVEALREEGLNAIFITTGQTGLLQGSKYGVAIDVLTSGYASGEVENAIVEAYETEQPDIIVVEGQGALSHPAFTSSSAIIKGAVPSAIIIQHPPKRKSYCDYPDLPMPTLESEIELIEISSKSKVIAITINHENMTESEVEKTIDIYENKYKLPTTDILKHGAEKLVKGLYKIFPNLEHHNSIV